MINDLDEVAMPPTIDRIVLLTQFEQAPPSALFDQNTVAAVRHCSLATVERDRWAGGGIPFIKDGRRVLYRKSDIVAWIEDKPLCTSTSDRRAA